MNYKELTTPAILLDLDIMESNLHKYHSLASKAGKQVWPMIKTHKSLYLAKLQHETGCSGFLCGTLDEAELLVNNGFHNIMYAYPVSSKESILRVAVLAQKTNFIIRLDNLSVAAVLNDILSKKNVFLSYTIIIDSGLHRFGITPSEAVNFLQKMSSFSHLIWKGISTHPGHVYSASSKEDLSKYTNEEHNAIHEAVDSLTANGFIPEIVSTGSTPTFMEELEDPYITIVHPGNYIFHDYIQMSLGIAKKEDCALYVLSSVISNPEADRFICDAGAKCLGLDKGAHGNSAISGHGYIVNHPEITVTGLSEEVGKLHINSETNLKIGDKIQIIPNHSCSSANLTDYFIAIRKGEIEGLIYVDARGNRKHPDIPVIN